MTPAGTSNELDIQNEWEENTHTHTQGSTGEGCQSCLWSAKQGKLIFPWPRWCLRIWSRETVSAVLSRVSLLISILRLNLALTYGIPPEFRGGVHLFVKPPYAIGSVPSLSGHAIAYQWLSLPRVRRHRASKPQGSSERVLPWPVPMDQLICASLSHTHYWFEVGMLKVPLYVMTVQYITCYRIQYFFTKLARTTAMLLLIRFSALAPHQLLVELCFLTFSRFLLRKTITPVYSIQYLVSLLSRFEMRSPLYCTLF